MHKFHNHSQLAVAAAGLALATVGRAAEPAAAPAAPVAPPPPKWTGSASLGMTLQNGNTEAFSLTGDIEANRKWQNNEINLRLDGTYATSQGAETANNVSGSAQYNRLFTERMFGYARLDGLYDPIAAIDYRFVFGMGGGYYFIKTADTQFRGEVGPGVVFEKQGGVQSTYATLRFADRFDQKLAEKTKLWQTAEFLPQVDEWGNYIINAEVGIETTLTQKLVQRTFIQDSYHSKPAPGKKQNDVKLVVAIGYKF